MHSQKSDNKIKTHLIYVISTTDTDKWHMHEQASTHRHIHTHLYTYNSITVQCDILQTTSCFRRKAACHGETATSWAGTYANRTSQQRNKGRHYKASSGTRNRIRTLMPSNPQLDAELLTLAILAYLAAVGMSPSLLAASAACLYCSLRCSSVCRVLPSEIPRQAVHVHSSSVKLYF